MTASAREIIEEQAGTEGAGRRLPKGEKAERAHSAATGRNGLTKAQAPGCKF